MKNLKLNIWFTHSFKLSGKNQNKGCFTFRFNLTCNTFVTKIKYILFLGICILLKIYTTQF